MKSIKYIKESLLKFKQDALAKTLYDLIKYLISSYFFAILLNFIPSIKKKFALELSVTIWIVLTFTVFLIGISITISFLLFNKKFKRIQIENQIDDLTGLKITKH